MGLLPPRGGGRHPAGPSPIRKRSAQAGAGSWAAAGPDAAGGLLLAAPGPARPHAAAESGQPGVHPACGRRARAAHSRAHDGVAGRHRRPGRLRSHGGGGHAAARDRHRRDAGRAAGRSRAVQVMVGPARPPAGADAQRRGAGGRGAGRAVVRRVLPPHHRTAARRPAGRHHQRPRAGRGGRRPPDRTRDADAAAPAAGCR